MGVRAVVTPSTKSMWLSPSPPFEDLPVARDDLRQRVPRHRDALRCVQSWWGLLAIPSIALVGLVFAITGLIYTYWIKHVDYLAYYWTLFITPMFMFAGVFFPLERLPQWIRTIAWFMPLYHGANLMRALMTEGDPSAALEAALWLLAVSVVLLPVPLVLLKRRLVGS